MIALVGKYGLTTLQMIDSVLNVAQRTSIRGHGIQVGPYVKGKMIALVGKYGLTTLHMMDSVLNVAQRTSIRGHGIQVGLSF